jgi:hypothetical protein
MKYVAPVNTNRFNRKALFQVAVPYTVFSIAAPRSFAASIVQEASLDILGQTKLVTPQTLSFSWLDQFLTQLGLLQTTRPTPMRIPRTSLYRPFAVLLMRSSYEAADDLDFVPMDRFQKEFFLLRADEWELYRLEHDVRQGDLSETAYFDFISAAQYATIHKLMCDSPSRVFEERVGAEGETKLVQRNAAVSDTALPALLLERAGDRILDGLYQNFTGSGFYTQPPEPCSDFSCLVKNFAQLGELLKENGYAKDIQVADRGDLTTQVYLQVVRLGIVLASNKNKCYQLSNYVILLMSFDFAWRFRYWFTVTPVNHFDQKRCE